MLAIRLPPKMEKRLGALAKKTGRTKTFYAREALVEHMDDLEDLYLVRRRLADVDAGRVELVPLEDAMRERGLLRVRSLPAPPAAKRRGRAWEPS